MHSNAPNIHYHYLLNYNRNSINPRNSKTQIRFFLLLALFPIANYDRLFRILRGPEISDLGAHFFILFYSDSGPLQ